MFFDYRKSIGHSLVLLVIMNLVTYACFHTMYNLATIENVPSGAIEVLYYLHLVLSRCTDFLLPVIIASVTLLMYGRCEGKKWLIYTPVLSLSVVLYAFPYKYIEFIIGYGFATDEALIYSAIYALISVITLTLHSLLLFSVAYIYLRGDKRDGKTRERIAGRMVYTDKLSLKAGPGFPIFLISLCEFIYCMATEIYDTVMFFINYGLRISLEEAVTIVLTYVLIIGLFALSTFLCDAILRFKFKNDFYEVIDDANDA